VTGTEIETQDQKEMQVITPDAILSLTADEQAMADLFEAHIDESIKATNESDPCARSFDIDTAAFSKSIKDKDNNGLSIKVRAHVEDQYVDAGWKVKMDEKGRILTIKTPRKYKARKPKEAAPAAAPAVSESEGKKGDAAAA